MLDKLKQLLQKVDQLTLRERVLVLLACLVVIYQAWDSLVWQPLVNSQDRLVAQELQTNQSMAQAQAELTIMSATAKQDPDRETREQIEQLQHQLSSLQSKIDSTSSSLISASDMAVLLEQLLTREKGLKLLSLQTGDSTPLISDEKKQATKNDYQIYKHVFTVEFEGSYLSTLSYIEKLEQLPWKFFWQGIDYKVDIYPRSKVKLTLYTLSLSEGWIGV